MAGKSSFLIFLFTFFSWFCNDTFGHVITRNLEPRRVLKDKHPVHGVEVNGLLFPLERFLIMKIDHTNSAARALDCLEELQIYRAVKLGIIMSSVSRLLDNGILISGELVPQDKLDSLMQEHWASFITDYDFSLLKEATIDSLRIPAPYSVFLSEGERTDKFPKGQALALDKYHRFCDTANVDSLSGLFLMD